MCYSEDERLLVEGQGFILFNILTISTAEAERLRLENETPYLKFERGPASATIATLEITSDF